jgi:hypothetical protein
MGKSGFASGLRACTALLFITVISFGCTSKPTISEPPPPPPKPLSLNELSLAFKNFPRCDHEKPACIEKREAAYNEGVNNANQLLTERPLAKYVIKITNIERSTKGGWDVQGDAIWDQADSASLASVSMGLLGGALTAMSGRGADEAAATSDYLSKGTRDSRGECLTTTQEGVKPGTQVKLDLSGVTIANLDGIEEHALIQLTGTDLVPINAHANLFGTDSKYLPGFENDLGELWLTGSGGAAVLVKDAHVHKYCMKGRRET